MVSRCLYSEQASFLDMLWPFQRLLSVFSTRLNFLAVARIFGDNWAFRSARARSIESILVEWRIFEDEEAKSKNAAFTRLRYYVRLSSKVIYKKLDIAYVIYHKIIKILLRDFKSVKHIFNNSSHISTIILCLYLLYS